MKIREFCLTQDYTDLDDLQDFFRFKKLAKINTVGC